MLLNLLSAAALVVGVAVGLIPALLLGMFLGLVPRPPLLRSRRPTRAPPPLERPAAERTPPPPVAAPMASAASISIPIPVGVEVEPPPPDRADVAAARGRHRGLYDDEYAKQLDHLDALRRTISTRLAVGARPVSDDAPRET